MGWKTFKEKFRIKNHIIHEDAQSILISSSDEHNIASINKTTGKIADPKNILSKNYPELSFARQYEILAAIEATDLFSRSIPLYSFRGGEIIEHACETLGHPNVTHGGEIIYENIHMKSIGSALNMAKHSLETEAKYLRNYAKELNSTCEEHSSNKDSPAYISNKAELDGIEKILLERNSQVDKVNKMIRDRNTEKKESPRSLQEMGSW